MSLDILGAASIVGFGWLLVKFTGDGGDDMFVLASYAMLYLFPILVPLLVGMAWLSLRFLRRLSGQI